ncbi:MAG: nuclease SbcCD subunit C [Chloroflexi bacterium CSP1-4]|nr:MAG: nuclease SbcCD subunit C [Chloroflexi bacterium CSP1-4]
MRIERLRLRDLMRHADLDLELAPGLTVVRGPNESGKSTIQRAIEFAFFRKVTAAGQDVEGLRRWGAGQEAAPVVELDFVDDAGVAGHLVKTFAGVKGRAELLWGDDKLNDPAAIERRLAELTGIPNEKFFRSTAAVRHEELADLDRDETTLRDRLQMSVSGADRGIGAARKKLDDAVRKYTTEGAKNPGMLKTARERAAALEIQLSDGESALARLEEERSALSRARDADATAERQLKTDRDQLAAAERAVALLARQQGAQARYERYRRATELRDEIAAKEAGHPARVPLSALRASVERLRVAEKQISEYRAELADQPEVSGYDVGALPTPSWRRWAVVALLLAVVGIVIAATGTVGPFGTVPGFVGLGIAALGLLIGATALVQQRRSSDVRRQNVLREEQISRRLRGRSEIEQLLRDTEARRDGELEVLELADVAAAELLLEAETAHVAAIDQLKAEQKGLLGDERPADDVARLRDAAAAEAEQARHALAGMGEIGAEPAKSRERCEATVRASQAERERAMHEMANAEGRVDANKVDAEAVAVVAEQLFEARRRLAAAERRLRIVRTTLETLDAAEKATMRKAARFLEKRMAGDVARITGGRYRRIRVDEAELTFSVFSPETGDWVDVRSLSQGTLDQFYLAARLGLVRQVTQDRRPPLVFDDPFLTFDDVRAREALQLLRETAAELQVIYLTTSDRYDDVADRVVVLPAPTERDTQAPDEASVGAA